MADLSGLHYDADRDRMLVACDGPNLFLELARTGEVTAFYALPGDNQEGITLDAEGNVYLAQDTGGVVKHRPIGAE